MAQTTLGLNNPPAQVTLQMITHAHGLSLQVNIPDAVSNSSYLRPVMPGSLCQKSISETDHPTQSSCF